MKDTIRDTLTALAVGAAWGAWIAVGLVVYFDVLIK
jgi:hypothetical protein